MNLWNMVYCIAMFTIVFAFKRAEKKKKNLEEKKKQKRGKEEKSEENKERERSERKEEIKRYRSFGNDFRRTSRKKGVRMIS